MWWRTAWPKTRSKLSSSKGSASASVTTVVTPATPSESAVALSREALQHPGRDVGRGQPFDDAELHEVEREVAGAGADLEPVAEALPVVPAERLDQLGAHLPLPGGAEVDAPLGVVFVCGGVVVAGVDVLDVLGRRCRGSRHAAGNNTVPGP